MSRESYGRERKRSLPKALALGIGGAALGSLGIKILRGAIEKHDRKYFAPTYQELYDKILQLPQSPDIPNERIRLRNLQLPVGGRSRLNILVIENEYGQNAEKGADFLREIHIEALRGHWTAPGAAIFREYPGNDFRLGHERASIFMSLSEMPARGLSYYKGLLDEAIPHLDRAQWQDVPVAIG